MNHEHDVLSRLVDYHDHISAPHVPLADDLQRGRRRVRRNRGLLAGGAVLAVVVSVIAVGSQLTSERSADPPQPADRRGLTTPLVAPKSLLDVRELGFHVEQVPDLVSTGGWAIDPDRQATDGTVFGEGGPPTCR